MKTIRMLITAAAAALAFCSCEGDSTIMAPKPEAAQDPDQPLISEEIPDKPEEGDGETMNIIFEAVCAELYRCGDDYGPLDTEYCDWYFILYADEEDPCCDYVELDFFTEADVIGMPEGTFTIQYDEENYFYFPGCAIPFYYDEEYMYGYGCHYSHEMEYTLGATDGTMTISITDNGIKIAYEMLDEEVGASFSGTYEGSCPIYDYFAEESSRHLGKRHTTLK